jgi:diadenosine tetraphosphate (Ap4A) HIT family hydrolase
METCLLCSTDFSKSLLHEGKYWNIVLNIEQHYLGRSFIMLKRHEENVFKLTREEREELWDLAKKTVEVLTRVFHPDMFNFAILGKLATRHIHLHIYPRYKEKRITFDETFEDERFGQNFGSYEKREIENEIFAKITNEMREEFKKP